MAEALVTQQQSWEEYPGLLPVQQHLSPSEDGGQYASETGVKQIYTVPATEQGSEQGVSTGGLYSLFASDVSIFCFLSHKPSPA